MSNKEYYYEIDMIKLLCAFIVVSIHTTLFMDINPQLYYIYGNYVTRFAVPFFFISSGFFFTPLLSNSAEPKAIRSNIKRYFLRLLRPFVLWGVCYFILSVLEDVVIEHNAVKTVLWEKFHLLLVESPGGGLWYVYAVLWITAFLFVFYKHKREIPFFIISFVLFLIPSIWNPSSGGLTFMQPVYDAYYKVFLSERNCIFYAVYFFTGIILYNYLKRKIAVWKLLLIQAALYLAFVLLCNIEKNVFVNLLQQMNKYFIATGWFLIALHISNKCIRQGWLRDNARKMSTIVYFTHFMSIYLVKIVLKIIGLKFDNCCSLAFVFCTIILIVYSVVFIKLDKKKKAIRLLY